VVVRVEEMCAACGAVGGNCWWNDGGLAVR
jgi:hypothetical protein